MTEWQIWSINGSIHASRDNIARPFDALDDAVKWIRSTMWRVGDLVHAPHNVGIISELRGEEAVVHCAPSSTFHVRTDELRAAEPRRVRIGAVVEQHNVRYIVEHVDKDGIMAVRVGGGGGLTAPHDSYKVVLP